MKIIAVYVVLSHLKTVAESLLLASDVFPRENKCTLSGTEFLCRHIHQMERILKTGNILRGYRSKKLYLELNKKGSGELFGHMIIPHNDAKLDAADNNLVLISKYASSRSPDEILQVAQSNYTMWESTIYSSTTASISLYTALQVRNRVFRLRKSSPSSMFLRRCVL